MSDKPINTLHELRDALDEVWWRTDDFGVERALNELIDILDQRIALAKSTPRTS